MSDYIDTMLNRMKWAARRFQKYRRISDYYKANKYIHGLLHAGTPTRAGAHNMELLIKKAIKLK